MVSLDDAVIARLSKKGESFEILLDPEIVESVKFGGKELDIFEDLAINAVFRDAKKGDHASEEVMHRIFSTKDIEKIAAIIVNEGDIQLTTEQRKSMQKARHKQIVTYISQNAINPQTRTPHPPQRIENAMAEAKVHIDPFKPVEVQVQTILEALKPLLPIRFEKLAIAVKLGPDDYGKTYGDLLNFGKVTKQEWQKDGSWVGVIEIPAGMQTDFFDRINAKTKGNAETKILE